MDERRGVLSFFVLDVLLNVRVGWWGFRGEVYFINWGIEVLSICLRLRGF